MKNIQLKTTIVIILAILLFLNFNGCSKDTKSDIGIIIDSKLNTICNTPSVSSNPYDYIKDSKDIEDIVSMGNDALTYMLAKFEVSKENGLKEYVMAIACSKIIKENPENKKWASGREWYDNYIKAKK